MKLKRKGLTLLELMIAVAIIGIISAIASSSLMGLIKKSKKSEISHMVNGIYVCEADYSIDSQKFHITSVVPAGSFNPANLDGNRIPGSQQEFKEDTEGFAIIGFVPDQDVYSGFKVDATDVTSMAYIKVMQDLDDDDTIAVYSQRIKRNKETGDAYKFSDLVISVED
ncbi:MAG: prepilin-type N-terminal cleavage/methylation domain-containing protein [Pseudomonadota bacterium]